MRLQLIAALAVVLAASAIAPRTARGDGTLAMRGVYYKERSTRVMQPMIDGLFDAGAHGVVSGHFLIDAITSASASSGADDAKPFTEERYEGGLGYSQQLGDYTLAAEGKYSTESDYKSRYVGLRGQAELLQKNLVLGLGAGFSDDTISAGAAQGPFMPSLRCDAEHPAETECALNVYSVFASASQIVSRDAVIGASVDLSWLDGLQSNPYRTAIAGVALVPERHPDRRMRQSFAVMGRYYFADTETTLIGSYRYYRDDWKVHAHTPELRLVQELGRSADAALRYRYYTQDGAYFFHDRYPADDADRTQFVSDDVKLSTFDGHTIEAKLGVFGERFGLEGVWGGTRLEGIFEYAIQHNRFGNAVIGHVAVTIPFSY